MRIVLGQRTLDLSARRVDGPAPAALAPAEVRLLDRLVAARGEAVPTEQLRDTIGAASDNALSRAIVRLRAKLEDDPRRPRHLVSLRGAGLALLVPEAAPAPAPAADLRRPALADRLQAALAEPGAVTLLGPGGAGKTTLARAAAALRPGALFCDLVPARGRDDLWRIVAGTAAEPPPHDEAGARALARALGRRPGLLVVLDNAEPIQSDVSHAVEVLLTESPGLRVLTTSRTPLGSPVERRLEVPPLDPDEAEALYALRTGGPVEPEIRALLAEVDRLPLVVELVATQARALPAARLREVYGDRGLELATASHVPERQQTLGRVLDGSWALLPEAAREALIHLSAVSAALPPGCAEALVGGDGALDTLQLLVDAGLVAARGGRVALLDLVRRFAAERGGPAARAVAVARAAAWVLGTLGRRPTESGASWWARVSAETTLVWDVFAAAEDTPDGPRVARVLARATALANPQRRRACLRALDGALGDERTWLLLEAAEAVRYGGDETRALALLEEALVDAVGELRARAFVERAHLRRQLGDHAGAEEDLRAAHAQAAPTPRSVYALAAVLSYQGRADEAAAVAVEQAAVVAGSGYELPLRSLAAIAGARRDPEHALATFAELRRLAEASGAAARVAFVDAWRGEVLAGAGRWSEADAVWRASEEVLARLAHAVPLAELRCKRAWALACGGDPRAGDALLGSVEATATGASKRLATAWRALFEARFGDPARARAAREVVVADVAPWSLVSVLLRCAAALEARSSGDPTPLAELRAEAGRRAWSALPPGLLQGDDGSAPSTA